MKPRRENLKHTTCKPGAAVRLHGYAPARVDSIEVDTSFPASAERPDVLAHCTITARSPDWKAGNIGPHGYRTGERVTVRAVEAVPRDLVRVARGSGRLWWPAFAIEEEH